MGEIKAICISKKRGTAKYQIEEGTFVKGWGILSDAHAGHWHRQVSLLSYERFMEFKMRGADISYGAFGENLLVSGYDFKTYPVGTIFTVGNVVLRVTQIGKKCHSHCEIFHRMGECIMPHEGVFAEVICGGKVHVGDELKLWKNYSKFY
ncbi:MAG: MOSC domain-containing protein [Lachnospiraceae bacterium]|jgi:MOSC domain-containing protein YiiM|nr:MOSC domain-containing protein [Lachnospiraceae bacterium]